jgi:hypothetical protein
MRCLSQTYERLRLLVPEMTGLEPQTAHRRNEEARCRGVATPQAVLRGRESAARIWARPMTLAEAHGLNSKQLSYIRRLVGEHRNEIVEAWHAHFGRQE